MVGALPYMQRAARLDVLGAWTRLAGYNVVEPHRTHDQAWGALRMLVRRER